jgi:hypothetical protein
VTTLLRKGKNQAAGLRSLLVIVRGMIALSPDATIAGWGKKGNAS